MLQLKLHYYYFFNFFEEKQTWWPFRLRRFHFFFCTKVSPPQCGGAVLVPLSERWTEMARQLPRGLGHPVAPNRLETFFRLAVHW